MRWIGAAVAVVIVGTHSAGALGRSRVAVVALEEGEGYRARAWVAVTLRKQLSGERQVVDPALVFHAQLGPSLTEISKAKAQQKAAIALYDSLNFKKATDEFRKVVDLHRTVLLRGGAGKDYVKMLHYWGAAALYANDRKAAIEHFKEAFAFGPNVRPDPNIFSPDVVKAYEEAAQAPSDGALRIICAPAAEVTVNGEAKGITPLDLVGVRPGRHLIRLRRAGYEPDAQWITVTGGGTAEVRSELKAVPQLPAFRRTLKEAGAEIQLSSPGEGVKRLAKMLSADSVILVGGGEGAVQARWAEEGRWTKSHRGKVAPGGEREFVAQLLSAEAVVTPVGGCQGADDCASNEQCVDGKCVARVPPTTPIYKKWWFWTIVGAVVVGTTVGIAAGASGGTEDWKAELRPGGMQ